MTGESIELTDGETRRRLLDAAGEVFALRGFERATIREISRKAKANIAAVNYHFRDKRGLYLVTIGHLRVVADKRFQWPLEGSAEDRLRRFVRQYLRRLLDPGEGSWHGRVLAWEMSEPTPGMETVVKEEIREGYEILQVIIADLAGDVPPRVIAKCAASIVGQMLHYHFARPVLKLVGPVYGDLEKHVEELADHVTRFSLAGVGAIAIRYRK
jgi:AcrR family transcriptional regulator